MTQVSKECPETNCFYLEKNLPNFWWRKPKTICTARFLVEKMHAVKYKTYVEYFLSQKSRTKYIKYKY